MKFRPFVLEDWFAKYEAQCKYNIAESGVKPIDFKWFNVDIRDLKFLYGHLLGDSELREFILRDYSGLSLEQILVTNGCIEANFVAFVSVVQPGDHVIVEHPNYQQLYEVPRALGGKVDLLELSYEEDYKLDIDKLNEMVTPKTKLVVISHPNNPTGSTVTEKTLKGIIEIIEDNNSYLLSDELYRELVFSSPLPPAATLSDRAISTSGLSKLYGLPGLRIGWLVADEEIIDSAKEIRGYTTICNSRVGEFLAKIALRRKEELVARAERLAKTNLRIVRGWIDGRGDLHWVPPAGGVVAFPRIELNITSNKLCTLLAEKYKTLLVPGECFDVERHFRIGFGGDTNELRQGIKCVNEALTSIS